MSLSQTRARGTKDELVPLDDDTSDIEKTREKEAIKPPTNQTASEQLWSETLRICAVVGFYFFVSISMVFLNKNLMHQDFEFPLFITWYQLVVAIGCMWTLHHLGKHIDTFSMIPPIQFDTTVAKKVLPLACVFVGMISFNNLCLMYVEVTFYQVARSLTICFTIVFTYFILNDMTSAPAIQASAVVMTGFIIGSVGEVHFSWLGIIFGVISSAFVSLYGIYVKKVMPAVENDQWRLSMYNTLLSILLMFPTIVISGEASKLMECELLYETSTWVSMTITGVVGYLINIAVFLQIKYTSPLTNNISGTLKACVQTLFAMLIYRNPISSLNALGIILVILGSFWYSHIRYSEMKQKAAAQPSDKK